jgi:hypothetical protein
VQSITIDGVEIDGTTLPIFEDDAVHKIEVLMG